MGGSQLSGFYRLPVAERIDALVDAGYLDAGQASALKCGRHQLGVVAANTMVENLIATFALPLAIAPNFIIDGRECIVPLVVEEPSVVAALSNAARLARPSGGFATSQSENLATGQVHIGGVEDVAAAVAAIADNKAELLSDIDATIPRMVARGGGARDLDVRPLEGDTNALIVHLYIDTGDAMGANIVNTICEHIAPRLQDLSGGEVEMRILSNLTDRAVVTATVHYGADVLNGAAAAIARLNDIAAADPYRAATHNKGIMNGIDPLAIATGNDWRAIEAGAHAYAAKDGHYRPLTNWVANEDGSLDGRIELPLKVGTVGGTLSANPAARLGLAIAGVASASELAAIMAAVGLAQNFSALRALATTGIQRGHMRLHARSVAATAGVSAEDQARVVKALVAGGDISASRAAELASEQQSNAKDAVTAAGKVILFGEHAAVYGRRALALPLRDAISATARPSSNTRIHVPDWGVNEEISSESDLGRCVLLAAKKLDIADTGFELTVTSALPRGMGLGASAALAVVVTRALAKAFDRSLDDNAINEIAFACEKIAHGTPSGVDNTVATFAKPVVFKAGEAFEILAIPNPPLLVVCSHTQGSTLQQVAGVRERYERVKGHYDSLFDQMDALTQTGIEALHAADYTTLGEAMSVCHGLLGALQVSTPEIEFLVDRARQLGALGAKLTGGGGGGSIVVLCPDNLEDVRAAMAADGYRTFKL